MNPNGSTYSVAGLGACIDTDIVIPASVVKIDKCTFVRCRNLKIVTFLSIPTIINNAFKGSSVVSKIHYNGTMSK